MINSLSLKPETLFNPEKEAAPFIGVFPGTFTEKMSAFAKEWQPTQHVNCESAILPVAAIQDGLPKFVEWPGGDLLPGCE